MKSEGFARAILIYHVNFTMGTVFFSMAQEKKRKEKSITCCVSKTTCLKSFRCFRLHYTPQENKM